MLEISWEPTDQPPPEYRVRYFAVRTSEGYVIHAAATPVDFMLKRNDPDFFPEGETVLYGPCDDVEDVMAYLRDIDPDAAFEDEDISPFGDLP